ncbi:MAG: acetylglutamate kinase [Armatimonadetes bacterium]|nr:acetylglutamate kinase [Armatimonadota bacterium]
MIREPGPSLEQSAKWIAAFHGQKIVVKLGGELLENPATISRLGRQIAVLHQCGLHVVIVHGAGKQVDAECQKRGLEIKKVDGRRITDPATRDAVVDVMAHVNDAIRSALSEQGLSVTGMSDLKDHWPVIASLRPPHNGTIDLGLVGDVQNFDQKHLPTGSIAVLPSLGYHPEHGFLNINADTLARQISSRLAVPKLIFMTGVSGVLSSLDAPGPISQMSVSQAQTLIENGTASGGMKAKLSEAIAALESGVEQVHIISGKEPYTLLREVFTDEGCGTLITR